jgi:hypothetical protein
LKNILIFCLFSLALNAVAYCGQLSKIELADGSVINGEIVTLVNGVYTIKNTATFGEIKVGSEKISKIETANPALPDSAASLIDQANNPNQSQVSTYGQALMKNPENAAIVTGLAKDPALRELANDPELQAAAKKGDIQALLKNPKFMDIVNSPEIQESLKKLKQ